MKNLMKLPALASRRLLAELDWLAKFLISYEVKVVPGSVRFMTRTSSEVNVAEKATDAK